MKLPTKFFGTKPKKETEEIQVMDSPFSLSKLILLLIVFVILVSVIAYGSYRVMKEYTSWTTTWNEVKFAHEHPQYVRALKSTYDSKMSAAESDILTAATASAQPVQATVTASPKQ